jgi:hypothetical protein
MVRVVWVFIESAFKTVGLDLGFTDKFLVLSTLGVGGGVEGY